MNTTRHTAGRTARRTLLLAGTGLAIGFGWGPARDGLAQSTGFARPPAARLAPPQPLEAGEAVARAAPFEFTRPGDGYTPPQPAPTQPIQQTSSTIPEDWTKTFSADSTRQPGDGGLKGFVTNSTQAVRSAFGAKPPEPPPQPRIGQVSQIPPPPPAAYSSPSRPPQTATKPAGTTRPSGWDPAAPRPQPVPGVSPTGTPLYAGKPAYRWYGWGATTPGANPYAPTGESPQGSSLWYAQSGATPGAFPVPVANPFRPPPGAEPPVYVATAPPPPRYAAPVQASVQVAHAPVPAPAPPPKLIAQTPAVAYTPRPLPAPPAAPVPPPSVNVPAILPAPPEARWQPSGTPISAHPVQPPADPIVPTMYGEPQAKADTGGGATGWQAVARGQQPADDPDAGLAAQIRAACQNLVTGVTVERAGPGRLVVSYSATTETLAGIAARAVSAIPALKPVAVEFRTTITAR